VHSLVKELKLIAKMHGEHNIKKRDKTFFSSRKCPPDRLCVPPIRLFSGSKTAGV
jgi:hypothetical protein